MPLARVKRFIRSCKEKHYPVSRIERETRRRLRLQIQKWTAAKLLLMQNQEPEIVLIRTEEYVQAQARDTSCQSVSAEIAKTTTILTSTATEYYEVRPL